MTLREKLMHYTHDLDFGSNLKQEAIATIEQISQYMDEDELLNHSRPLALAYLALTEDASAPVVRCKDCKWFADNNDGSWYGCWLFYAIQIIPEDAPKPDDFCSCGEPKMEGGAGSAGEEM